MARKTVPKDTKLNNIITQPIEGVSYLYDLKNSTNNSHEILGEYTGIVVDDDVEHYKFIYNEHGKPVVTTFRVDQLNPFRLRLWRKGGSRKYSRSRKSKSKKRKIRR